MEKSAGDPREWWVTRENSPYMSFARVGIGQNACSVGTAQNYDFFFLDAADCSDLKTVRGATAAVTIIFCLAAIISFIGSIYGCIGTCCAPAVIFNF